MNGCVFSECRRYRYVLDHDESDLFSASSKDYVSWLGLNPSIADEERLDPTLRRINTFTRSFGYHRFMMLNLFALVSTDPKAMLVHPEPVGPENDEHILRVCQDAKLIICCWGSHGRHMARADHVLRLLSDLKLKCLGVTATGEPLHPLYLSSERKLIEYKLKA